MVATALPDYVPSQRSPVAIEVAARKPGKKLVVRQVGVVGRNDLRNIDDDE